MKNISDLIKKLDIKVKKLVTSNFLGNYKTAFKGQGIEFKDIRPYQEGDPYKSIDRITTAKKGGELHIREFEEERQLTLRCLCDCSSSMNRRYDEISRSKKETMRESFYTLGMTATANNDRVASLCFDEEHIISDEKPSKQKISLIKTIAQHTEENTVSQHQHINSSIGLNTSLRYLNKKKTTGSFIIIFTDKEEEIDKKALKILATTNDILFVSINDQFENTLTTASASTNYTLKNKNNRITISNQSDKKDKYEEQRREQKEQLKKEIQRTGSSFISMDNNTNIGASLLQYFMQK